jgi:hypothetical protein
MQAWWQFAKTIYGYMAPVAAMVLFAWVGLSELYRWYATGQILAGVRARSGPATWRLIDYENDPWNFVAVFAIHVMLTAIGLLCGLGIWLRVRRWWHNKPKHNE